MGFTMVKVTVSVSPLANGVHAEEVECLVDTGAYFSVIPADILRKAGILPRDTQKFTLANGHTIVREVGDAVFQIGKHKGASPVVFGHKGDKMLLGVVALEAMCLEVDPRRRKLKPTELLLL